jgi:hypothetical protein
LLDGRSQPPGSAWITQFRVEDKTAFVQAQVTWDEGVYAGVQMHRIILWQETYFIDAFWVDGPDTHQIDWIYHNAGELAGYPESGKIAEGFDRQLGYDHIDDVTQIAWGEDVHLSWRTNNECLALLFAPQRGEEIFVGHAPGNPASEKLSVIARRQRGRSALFLSVFCLSSASEKPVVRRVLWSHADTLPQEIVIEKIDGSDKWIIHSPIPDPLIGAKNRQNRHE